MSLREGERECGRESKKERLRERQRVSVKNKRKMGERESYITSVKERERGV